MPPGPTSAAPDRPGRARPTRDRPAATRLLVTGTEDLTPTVRRVWFRSDDLSAFLGSDHTDRYVKLVLGESVRTYTALFPDVEAGTLAIDFVLHGDQGVAGPWAAAAQPGDELEARGPGGGYRPDPTADWHLLVGDESALPAITAALADLAERSPDAVVRVLLEVDGPDGEPALRGTAGTQVSFVHRGDGSLLDAVRRLEWLPGRVQAFVHGEAETVMRGLRPWLLGERGLTRDQVSISGYWRRGGSEEEFRVWKRDLAATEAPAEVPTG
ncbi:siderophore-interacting protein [Nocardioides campestrisoli]|uniref:siderophore-interacting protein n=1 Tax=Nocardioides campestrisoli TaxID=2736757 RepID=UPI00163D99A3|nr:siderophore-interacting protein [Nocardioides campestrisoli]